MKTVIIGSGNVAYHLAKAFAENKVDVKQLYGRNESELRLFSEEFKIPYSTSKIIDADLYIIAVSDRAVTEVSQLITNRKALVAHTSGSLPISALKGDYRKASFYPLQTFSKNKKLNYVKIPFFIEAENDEDAEELKNLALKISPNVMDSSYEKRKYIHLTAVFACNFVNHLFARAKEISDSQNIPFDYFIPLIDETVEKIHSMNPQDVQTGPAIRNDLRILEMHQKLIDGEHLNIYTTMNESIKKMYEL